MPCTLFLTGSLAPLALEKRLKAEAGNAIVLEFDTLLDRDRYPQVTEWLNLKTLLTAEISREVKADVSAAVEFYLRLRPEVGDQTGDGDLRRTAMHGAFIDSANTQLLNAALHEALVKRCSWDRLVIVAGCGVHFGFWRNVAKSRGIELEVLPPETVRRSLSRQLERWYYKRRGKKAAKSKTPPSRPFTAGSPEHPLVACISKRVSMLLEAEKGLAPMRVRTLTLADLGAPDPALIETKSRHYQEWWRRWRSEVLYSESSNPRFAALAPVYEAAGADFVQRVYPRWAALKAKACELLANLKPSILLTDTQLGDEELVWALAARAKGIPVVAYSYDHIVHRLISFVPDWVLADGMRTIPRALEGQYPMERMINIRSHRRPTSEPLSAEEFHAAFEKSHPVILFADPPTIAADPQMSARCCKVLIETARQLPHLQFVIKFHPLRAPKTEGRSFVGMDESEVTAKRRFIKSLRPPGNVRFLAPEASMEEALRKTSVLLSTNSMSGHEAFHLGVPVIFLCSYDTVSVTFPEIEQRMQPMIADTADELMQHLAQLTGSPACREGQVEAQKSYLNDYYWSSRLSLSEAVATLAAGKPSLIACSE